MTEQEIINSSIFKFINHQIDEKVAYIQARIASFKDRVHYAFEGTKFPTTIDTRVYEEVHGRAHVVLEANVHDLLHLRWTLDEIEKTQEEVHELNVLKLRLLNDYDFTKGDNSLAEKIFGGEDGADSKRS